MDYTGKGQYLKKGNKRGNNKLKGLSPNKKKQHREKGLCFKYRLLGHQAVLYRKQLNTTKGKQLNIITEGSLLDQ